MNIKILNTNIKQKVRTALIFSEKIGHRNWAPYIRLLDQGLI